MLDKQTKLAILHQKLNEQEQFLYSEEIDQEIEGTCGGDASLIMALKASIERRKLAEQLLNHKIDRLESE